MTHIRFDICGARVYSSTLHCAERYATRRAFKRTSRRQVPSSMRILPEKYNGVYFQLYQFFSCFSNCISHPQASSLLEFSYRNTFFLMLPPLMPLLNSLSNLLRLVRRDTTDKKERVIINLIYHELRS